MFRWVIYLKNDMPNRYLKARNTGKTDAYWQTMQNALAKAGLEKARARITYDGKPARRTEIRYFKLGKIHYHAVLAEVEGR